MAVGGAFSVTLIPAILSGLAGPVYGPTAIMREKEIVSIGCKLIWFYLKLCTVVLILIAHHFVLPLPKT